MFAQRYEQGSLLVTFNLPFPQWTSVFGDAELTADLLDRLTHHCQILQFEWESIRLTQILKGRDLPKEKRETRAVAAPTASAGPEKEMI